MSLAFPTSFPATLGLPWELVLNFQRVGDEDHGQYEVCLLSDCIPPMPIAFASGATAPCAFLALMADDACDLGGGNFPAAAVLVLRDLAHQAVDMVCSRLSSEPVDSAVFADPAPASLMREWSIGDWFMLDESKIDERGTIHGVAVELYGLGPFRVDAFRGGDHSLVFHKLGFGMLQEFAIPCAAPTDDEEAP